MQQTVYVNCEMSVLDGRIDEVKAVAEAAVAEVLSHPGVLSYCWWVSADGKTLHVHERYENSEAVLAQMMSGGKVREVLGALVKPERLVVVGPVSETLRSVFNMFSPLYLTEVSGFCR